MIKSYKFIETTHSKLHKNVIAFFDRIENETGVYSSSFFDKDFYNKIVKHHPKILEEPLKKIYNELRTWPQGDRTDFCNKIRMSNDIEKICNREIAPTLLKNIPDKLKAIIKKLFYDLYVQVLSGDNVKNEYGSLQQHFEEFKSPNKIFKCPTCGLMPSKSKTERKDDYDHYLAKDKFPFSSINFRNLVPICTDCNSSNVKGNRDVLKINGKRKIFYPFDETHTGIKVECRLNNDNVKEDDLDFSFEYTTDDNRDEEIESWKVVFKIDDRYKKRSKGKAQSWYQHYWQFISKPKYKGLDINLKKELYKDFCLTDPDIEFIKLPVIKAVEKSSFAKALLESKLYSMQFNH